MAFTEALRLVIDADTRGAVQGVEKLGATADRELSRTDKSLDKLGLGLTRTGAGMVAVGSAALVGLGMAAKSAGQLEQAVGGTEAVFGDAADAIDKYADTSAEKLGLSERAFRELTTVAGAQLKNLGFDVDEAAEKSVELTQIGADLAATFGGTTQEAVEALGAAFRGEADPAERFGLRLGQTAVNAKAVELGLAQSTGSVSDYAKAQATLALITEQSADAQGRFAAESDTLAGRQQRLSAAFENLQASIGEGALPVFENMIDVASKGVGAFTDLDDATGGTIGKLAAYGSVAAIAAGGISFVAGQAITARQNLLAMAGGVQSLVRGLGGLKVAAVGATAAMAAIVASVELAKLDDAASAKRAERVFGMDRLVAALREGGDEADRHVRRFVALADELGFLEEAVRRVSDVNPGLSRDLIAAAEAAGIEESKIRELRDVLSNHESAAAAATEGQAGLAGAMGESASMTDTATTALKDYADALAAQFDPLFGMQDALVGAEDAQRGVAEAQTALNEALASGDPTIIADAQRAYDGALRDAQVAIFGVQQAQITLNDAVANGKVDVADAQHQLYQWAIAAGYTHEQAMIMADGLNNAAGAAAYLGAQDPTVSVTVTGKEQSINDIDAIQNKINSLRGRDVGIRIVGTAVGAVGGGVMRMHEGGVVPGRRGEEVAAILQGGEQVIPLDAPRLMPADLGMYSPASFTGGGGRGSQVLEIRFTGAGNGLDTYFMKQVRTGGIHLLDGNGRRVRVAT